MHGLPNPATDSSMDVIEPTQFLKLIAALVFVVALMGGLSIVIRKLGLAENVGIKQGQKRLKIKESLALDARRRAVLIQCDDEEHLVLLGPNSDTIIRTGIKPPKQDDSIT